MPECGHFITINDRASLGLSLRNGIFGSFMKRKTGTRVHYDTLADYACTRKGMHVFFFMEKQIIYGGIVAGQSHNEPHGAFILNDQLGLFRNIDAPLVWDVAIPDADEPKCIPYLIQFEQGNIPTGTSIEADDYYFKLSRFHHPLPTNSIHDRSFCPMSPFETRCLLELLEGSDHQFPFDAPRMDFPKEEAVHYEPQHGRQLVEHWSGVVPESIAEFLICGDSSLLGHKIGRLDSMSVCRQVPMPPSKPPIWMYRGDVCYYSESSVADGSLPNVIVELKKQRATKDDVGQVERYLMRINQLGEIDAGLYSNIDKIRVYLVAPGLDDECRISSQYEDRISLVDIRSWKEFAGSHMQERLSSTSESS